MRGIKYATGFTLITVLLLTGYACSKAEKSAQQTQPATATSEIAEGTAAIVNGAAIPQSELETAVRNIVKQSGMGDENMDAFMGQFGPRILEQLIDAELLYQAARDGGYLASQEDVDRIYGQIAGRYEDPAKFKSEMEARGFTEASLKKNLERQLSIQKYIDETIVPKADVPEETVKEAYDQNPQNFTREEEIRASHILISSSESDPKEKKEEALKKAREVAKLAKAKGADFAELAKTYSEGPSGPSGGDLGFFSRGRMVKPFEDAAFAMKVNEVSDPVLTQFGYHIIKVTGHHDSTTIPYEEVKEKLAQDLKNRMVNELIGKELTRLREKAQIQVLFEPTEPAPQEAPDSSAQEQTSH